MWLERSLYLIASKVFVLVQLRNCATKYPHFICNLPYGHLQFPSLGIDIFDSCWVKETGLVSALSNLVLS